MKLNSPHPFQSVLTALFSPNLCLYCLQTLSFLLVLFLSPLVARADDGVILSFDLPNDPLPTQSTPAPVKAASKALSAQPVDPIEYAAPGLDQTQPVADEKPEAPAAKPLDRRLVASAHPGIGLDFTPKPVEKPLLPAAPEQKVKPLQRGLSEIALATSLKTELFNGHENSLAAKAIGAAEGTRTPTGIRTPAYYGHVDPGNGAWNLGTFSYQHGATSPEEADRKQLNRLARQADVLQEKALNKGMVLTVEEKLNGLDLANQAPLAALGEEGYIDWLAEAHRRGLTGADAVIWARTYSFINPRTGKWDAPGLGNNLDTIVTDQERRFRAIDRTITAHRQQEQDPSPSAYVHPQVMDRPPQAPAAKLSEAEMAEQIIGTDLPKSPSSPAKTKQANTPATIAPPPAAADPMLTFNQAMPERSTPESTAPSQSQEATPDAMSPTASPMTAPVETIDFVKQP